MAGNNRSFYDWLMTNRNTVWADEIQHFANNAFLDLTFPKQCTDFEGISKYLEENTSYLMGMTTFDKAWEMYQAAINN